MRPTLSRKGRLYCTICVDECFSVKLYTSGLNSGGKIFRLYRRKAAINLTKRRQGYLGKTGFVQ